MKSYCWEVGITRSNRSINSCTSEAEAVRSFFWIFVNKAQTARGVQLKTKKRSKIKVNKFSESDGD